MRTAIKILLTIVTLIWGVLPAIADLNETHLYNPGWSPHARVHAAWFLFFGAAMAFISLYFAWIKDQLTLPAFIGLMFTFGFWTAYVTAPIYGGALVDENGIETKILGLESNVFTFAIVTSVLMMVMIYEFWPDRNDANE